VERVGRRRGRSEERGGKRIRGEGGGKEKR
jgi:hypothetical protein